MNKFSQLSRAAFFNRTVSVVSLIFLIWVFASFRDDILDPGKGFGTAYATLFTLFCFYVAAAFRAGRKTQQGVALVAGGIVAALVAGELFCGVFLKFFADKDQRSMFAPPLHNPSDSRRYQPHHYLTYLLKPDYFNPKTGTRHNAYGFRGKEFSVNKPDGVFRVVALGGSTTYTVGVPEENLVYTRLLEDLLNREADASGADKDIEVLNAGVGGWTSAETLISFIVRVLEVEPDLILVQQGLNDFYPRIYGEIKSDYSNYRRIWRRERSFETLLKKSNLLRFILIQAGILKPESISLYIVPDDAVPDTRLLDDNTTDYFRRNTEILVRTAKDYGIDVVLVSEHFTEELHEPRRRATEQHSRILEEVAEKEDVLFMDLHALMNFYLQQSGRHYSEIMPDNRHVNIDGSKVKAFLMFKYLEEVYNIYGRMKQGEGIR